MKNYITSNIKEINWQYWSFFNVRINVDELQKIKNSKWFANLVISKKKEVWKYWETHYCYQNDYDWNKKEEYQTIAPEIQDMPF